MKTRIAIWAATGLLVAVFWALFASLTFPSTDQLRDVWPLITVTCPIAFLGMHHAVSLHEALGANAVTYAVVGMMVETVRRQLHYAQ